MDYYIEVNLIQGIKNRDDGAFKHLHDISLHTICNFFRSQSDDKDEDDIIDFYNDGVSYLIEVIDKPNLEMEGTVKTLLRRKAARMCRRSGRKL
jgi:hypothetical protein